MDDKVALEIRKLNRYLKIAIAVYVIFWTLVILGIHLFMIPKIRGG